MLLLNIISSYYIIQVGNKVGTGNCQCHSNLYIYPTGLRSQLQRKKFIQLQFVVHDQKMKNRVYLYELTK